MKNIPIVSIVANIVMLILFIRQSLAYLREMSAHRASLEESVEFGKLALNRLVLINRVIIQDEKRLDQEVIFWAEMLDLGRELDTEEFEQELEVRLAEYRGAQL